MDYVLDGYCGLYCGACPMLLASKAGAADSCQGCKSERPAGHCATCDIKQCARERGFEFCFECAELESCERMSRFISDPQWPYHQGVMQNFAAIRQDGKEAWLKAQAARWQCGHCGQAHSWWDETCKACGEPVSNYKADLD